MEFFAAPRPENLLKFSHYTPADDDALPQLVFECWMSLKQADRFVDKVSIETFEGRPHVTVTSFSRYYGVLRVGASLGARVARLSLFPFGPVIATWL